MTPRGTMQVGRSRLIERRCATGAGVSIAHGNQFFRSTFRRVSTASAGEGFAGPSGGLA